MDEALEVGAIENERRVEGLQDEDQECLVVTLNTNKCHNKPYKEKEKEEEDEERTTREKKEED